MLSNEEMFDRDLFFVMAPELTEEKGRTTAPPDADCTAVAEATRRQSDAPDSNSFFVASKSAWRIV